MTRIFWILLIVVSVSLADSDFKETTNTCVTVSIPDAEMKQLRQMSNQLSVFLHNNLEAGHNTLKEVMLKLGADDVHVGPNDPLQTYLLQYQSLIHNDLKLMVTDLKKLFLEVVSGLTNEVEQSLLRKTNEVLYPGDEANISSSLPPKSTLLKILLDSHTGKISANDDSLNSLQEGRKKSLQDNIYLATDTQMRPSDCADILVAGGTKSGVYKIYPFRCRCSPAIEVYCDMDTDGGGWTIFLSRMNQTKQENFTRSWQEYKHGFGNAATEFWLGNEALHLMTFARTYILRIDVVDIYKREAWGEWSTFSVKNEEFGYSITVSGYNSKGTLYDGLTYHNAMLFTTYDRDNDKSDKNCAITSKGGWWYNNCYHVNPTGVYANNTSDAGIKFIRLLRMDPNSKSFAHRLQLKIRPAICSNTVSVVALNTHDCKDPTL